MRRTNVKKKKLRCLRCGKMMVTDIGHRFCRRCRRANSETYTKASHRLPTL